MRITLITLAALPILYLVGTLVLAGPTCAKPLPYRIGNVDPRFNLSEKALTGALTRAEQAWEQATGRDLLVYDPTAPLSINFIFDERQERTLQSLKLDEQRTDFERSQEKIHKEYGSISSLYDEKLAAYEAKVDEYRRRIIRHNQEVERWNSRGGAPEKEYKELQDDEEKLDEMAEEIEAARQSLNEYAERAGTLAERDQALVESYNQEVATFQEKYGETQAFDQGVFDGTSIAIYQFREEADLVLVLVHEFGHALGIDHVEDPRAIMYPLLEHQNIEDPSPLPADQAALEAACRLKENFLLRGMHDLLSKAGMSHILNPV